MKKYKQVDIGKAMKDIKKMLKATHSIKQTKDEYDYQGEEITHYSVLDVCNDIHDDVTKESLEYHKERGRDFLDVILLKTFQLGYNNAAIVLGAEHEAEIKHRDKIAELKDKIIDNLIEKQK